MVLLNKSSNSENRSQPQSTYDKDGGQGQGTMRRKRSKPPFQGYGKTFLDRNPGHNMTYHELLKEERTWLGQGQYWLSAEAGRRAKCLLDGDVEGSKIVTVSCGPCRQQGRENEKEAIQHAGELWEPPLRMAPEGCSCMGGYQDLFVKTKKF